MLCLLLVITGTTATALDEEVHRQLQALNRSLLHRLGELYLEVEDDLWGKDGQHAPEPDAAAKHSLLDLHVRKLAAQPAKTKSTVFIVVGTRPELIKMAPVIRRFKESPHFDTKVVNTGQHVELVNTLYTQLGITPDYNCELLEKGQSLVSLYARALERLGKLIAENPPDAILVQGDTLSAAAAAFVGFLNLIPVGHVEAGWTGLDAVAFTSKSFSDRISTSVLVGTPFAIGAGAGASGANHLGVR